MSEDKEQRARDSRKFLILVMLMFLTSIAVFVVGTYFFVIPRLISLNMEVAALKAQLTAPSAEVEAPAIEPERPLTPEEVTRRLKEERLAFHQCAEKHLNGQKDVSVVIGLTIDQNGQVRHASVGPTGLADSSLGKCLATHAAALKFRPHSKESVKVDFPLSFRRQ